MKAVGIALRVAVIVLQRQTALFIPANDPGAGVVLADMEGNPDLVGRAVPNMHDQARAGEIGVGSVRGHDPARESLPAQGVETGHEGVLLRRGAGHGGAGGQGKGGGEGDELFHPAMLAGTARLA